MFSFLDQFWFNFTTPTFSLRLNRAYYFLKTTPYKLCNYFQFLTKLTCFKHMVLRKESFNKNHRTPRSDTISRLQALFSRVGVLFFRPTLFYNLFFQGDSLHRCYYYFYQYCLCHQNEFLSPWQSQYQNWVLARLKPNYHSFCFLKHQQFLMSYLPELIWELPHITSTSNEQCSSFLIHSHYLVQLHTQVFYF